MDFWHKMFLIAGIVLYAMSLATFVISLMHIRHYDKKKKTFFASKEEGYILDEDGIKYWKNQYDKHVMVPVTIFLAFFINAIVFSILIFITN